MVLKKHEPNFEFNTFINAYIFNAVEYNFTRWKTHTHSQNWNAHFAFFIFSDFAVNEMEFQNTASMEC